MTGERICIAALPGTWPAAELKGGASVLDAAVRVRGPDGEAGRTARIVPPGLLPRFARMPAGPAPADEEMLVLVPIGGFDDGVWTPVIERLLADAAGAGRRSLLAWCGLEPWLAPFERRLQDIAGDPAVLAGLLGVLARHARSLTAVVNAVAADAPAGAVRQGFAQVEPGAAGGPVRLTLALG
jgi:hypothetical protein